MFSTSVSPQALAPVAQPIMPSHTARLLNAVAMDRFDPMIGFPFVMAITAGIVQKLARLHLSNAYVTELSLFFLIIAESGEGKGIVSAPILKPLHELVQRKRELDTRENQRRQAHNSALKGVIAEKKKSGRRLSGPALNIRLKEIEQLEAQIVPELPVFLFEAQDVTTAALINDLNEQDGHSLTIMDSEGRFMRSLAEDKPLTSLLNQAFVGEAVSNRRVSRKSVIVDNPHISICAAMQPAKLHHLARYGNLWGEGFVPRTFPYFAHPQVPCGPAVCEISDTAILDWWAKRLAYIFNLSIRTDVNGRPDPFMLYLDDDASRLFEDWFSKVRDMSLKPCYSGIKSNLSRLPMITARIAAIYHFLEHQNPVTGKVSGEMMGYAINAAKFFIPQIHKLYGWFNPDPVAIVLPKICDWLRSRLGTNGGYVTLKEIYGGCGSKKEGFQNAIKVLCSQGALQFAQKYKKPIDWWGINISESQGFLINFPALETVTYPFIPLF